MIHSWNKIQKFRDWKILLHIVRIRPRTNKKSCPKNDEIWYVWPSLIDNYYLRAPKTHCIAEGTVLVFSNMQVSVEILALACLKSQISHDSEIFAKPLVLGNAPHPNWTPCTSGVTFLGLSWPWRPPKNHDFFGVAYICKPLSSLIHILVDERSKAPVANHSREGSIPARCIIWKKISFFKHSAVVVSGQNFNVPQK